MYIADTVKPNDKTETIPVHELLCLSQYLSIISSLLLQGGKRKEQTHHSMAVIIQGERSFVVISSEAWFYRFAFRANS